MRNQLTNFGQLTRSGFKTSDQVQGQGAGRSRKRSIHGYVSIYRRCATQPLGLRWGFETISKSGICLAVIIGLFFGCASHRQADQQNSGPKRITDLSISQNSEALVVIIKANQSLIYTANRLDLPMGVLLYFPDTSLDLAGRVYTAPDNEVISSIKANEIVEDKTTSTRIFVAFKKDTPYELSPDVSGLRITFPKTAELPVEPKPLKKLAETIPPTTGTTPKAAPIARHLKQVTATPLKNNIAVNIIADGTIKNYRSFTLDQPARIVFDLYNLKSPYNAQQIIEVGSKWVKRVRHFGHPDKVRLVLETNHNYQKKYSAFPKDTGLLIHVGDIPAAAAAAGPTEIDDSAGTKQVTLTWDNVPGATSYNVYWSASPGVNRHNGNKISNIKDPTATIKGLKPGTTYYFVVTTVKGSAESPESEELSFTVGE
jgi:hypothetical protein